MKATYEEGTELVVDSETLALNSTWTDVATDIFRFGPMVTAVVRVKSIARAEWEKKKYKEGELATEGGHVYRAEGSGLVAKETDENKPSTKPTMWKDLGTEAANKVLTTLPVEYRPPVAVKDVAGNLEVTAEGEVKALDAVAAAAEHRYAVTYRVAGVSP